MATGALSVDILRQILAGAMPVPGVASAMLFGMSVAYPVTAIVSAVPGAVGAGLTFGFAPAPGGWNPSPR